jgi:hypothetical protein
LQECPKQPKIPLYLFIFGCFFLVQILQNLYNLWRSRRKDKFDNGDIVDDEEGTGPSGASDGSSSFVDILICTFLAIWFGFGNYWIWPVQNPNFTMPPDVDSSNWCARDVYTTAWFHLIGMYVMAAVVVLIVFMLFVYSKCCRVRMSEEDLNEQVIEG